MKSFIASLCVGVSLVLSACTDNSDPNSIFSDNYDRAASSAAQATFSDSTFSSGLNQQPAAPAGPGSPVFIQTISRQGALLPEQTIRIRNCQQNGTHQYCDAEETGWINISTYGQFSLRPEQYSGLRAGIWYQNPAQKEARQAILRDMLQTMQSELVEARAFEASVATENNRVAAENRQRSIEAAAAISNGIVSAATGANLGQSGQPYEGIEKCECPSGDLSDCSYELSGRQKPMCYGVSQTNSR